MGSRASTGSSRGRRSPGSRAERGDRLAPRLARSGAAFQARAQPLCLSLHWRDWSGRRAVSRCDRSQERERSAFRDRAGLLDVSSLDGCRVPGPEALRRLDRTRRALVGLELDWTQAEGMLRASA